MAGQSSIGSQWSMWRRRRSGSSWSLDIRRRRKLRNDICAALRNLLAFLAGLTLAATYGVMLLVLKGAPLWTCVYSTLALATLAAFGMGTSIGVRAAVMIMLPSLCSSNGRNFLLLVSTSVLMSGPVANMLANSERAASSLMCGAELAANQTRQLIKNAAAPLQAAVDHIKQIGRNAAALANRVNKLFAAISDGIRHVARTLRNVLHFLENIGNVCNDKMGAPARKCYDVFDRAKADCEEKLGEIKILCEIVSLVKGLCKIADVAKLFCMIPEYISAKLKEHLAEPAVSAFRKMKSHFEFNLSVSASFEAEANISRSPHETGQLILERLTQDFKIFNELRGPLVWAGLLVLGCSLVRAFLYQRRYLTRLNFDNVYISAQFLEVERQVTSEGGESVLPITRRESRLYIKPLALRPTGRERRAVLMGVVWVLRHATMSAVLVCVDYLVFWLLDQVHRLVQEGVTARAPVTVSVQVNGLGYLADIMRDLAASFNVLQAGNVTVISKKCLFTPSEPDDATNFALGFLLGLTLMVALGRGMVLRSRRLICAYFYPETEKARIRFLRQHILDERRAAGRAVLSATAKKPPKRAKLCGCLRLPAGADVCVTCGEWAGFGAFVCDVQRCPGVFCRSCFKSVGRRCDVCARPVSFKKDSQEEIDSSEDEGRGSILNLFRRRSPEPPRESDGVFSIITSVFSGRQT
ncbi:DC-STAMP domain-containing protein 2 isoform X1 [Stigmatopora argus]